jgi:hypothetical protein
VKLQKEDICPLLNVNLAIAYGTSLLAFSVFIVAGTRQDGMDYINGGKLT